ncbi:MAG: urease accessory UreF family protein [Betaproteobacteria bacterium]
MDGGSPFESGLALLRLLQLASPSLPIGGFSYSQALESVVDQGTVHDAASAAARIGDVLDLVIAEGEAPVAWRLLDSAAACDWRRFEQWNAWFRASRETAELRAETEQMGGSLARLASDLDLLDAAALEAARRCAPLTLPASFALAACGFRIAGVPALTAYLWVWLENQTMAAIKSVPLGQLAAQRLLKDLATRIPPALVRARTILDGEITSFAPGLALASARHETQYSRLFRS